MRPAQIKAWRNSLPLFLESHFEGECVSWDERNWCHLEPTSLACPDSDNAWLMGWLSGDPIFLVSCTSESDVRQMAVLSQPQLLSMCHGGTECGGSLALWVCRVRPKCRNTDLYSYQRRGCPN